MLPISKRAEQLPASPIRKLVPFAEAAKKRGVKVYHLNIGQPDIETPPQFMRAICDAQIAVLEYSHSAGMESLRQKIVGYYAGWNLAINANQIIVTNGASEALNFVCSAILDPLDELIIPEPFYANYLSFAMNSNGVTVPVPTNIEDDFALPEVSEFESKITLRTKGILICNPSNPTGVLYPRQALERLGALVRERDLYLIVDEVYREFNYSSEPFYSAMAMAGLEEHIVIIDSISKRFSACGARIGCVISRNENLIQAMMKMAQARLSPPTLGQLGASAVYDLGPEYYRQIADEYSHRRDILKTMLDQMPGVLCPKVTGAFYAMVRLPVADSDHFCQWMLEAFSHNGATVMMAPGSGFYATPGAGKDEVRIAYVLKAEDLKTAMECLAAGLVEYAKCESSLLTANG
jgi:aspartate aminotransferase